MAAPGPPPGGPASPSVAPVHGFIGAPQPGKGKALLSGAASKGYSVASTWEQTAALNEAQQAAVDLISQCCGERPLPARVAEEEVSRVQPSGGSEELAHGANQEYGGSLEEVVLQNSHQFYKWHSELEAARSSETEEKYKHYAQTLRGHLQLCQEILRKVDETLEHFEGLKAQHHEIASKTRQLHDSCERLVAEKEALVEFAEALRSKLAYFDELERVAAQFHGAALEVEADTFLPLLLRLDECIAYVTSNPQYTDASAYAGKFRQLQQRALATVRSKVQTVLRHAADQVQAAIREGHVASSSGGGRAGAPLENGAAAAAGQRSGAANGAGPALGEGTEAALLYVRFRAAAEPGLKGLLQGLDSRAKRPEYARLLGECQQQYCEVRLQLVSPVVAARIQDYARSPLPTLTRNACAYLMQVCQLEAQLFEHFFPPGALEGGAALEGLMEPLCTLLYDTLRPAFILLPHLDDLAQLIDILKHEVLEEQLGRRGDAVAPLRPVLTRTLADLQERLIFRAHSFIKEEVVAYQPQLADLDYPAKLLQLEQEEPPAPSGQPAAADAENGAGVASEADENGTAESKAQAYSAWYPPVRHTLSCLSQLYRCLDARIFGGLAQEAVSSCTLAVQAASRLVAKKSGTIDGQLFLIKQLLILREQIAPFEAEFAVVEKELDFRHMREHMRRIMSGHSNLFTLSADNAVVQMVSRGGPRILETHVDSKKELEKQLKLTCEAFIMGVTKLTVEDMLSFITKVTAVKVASASAGAKPLREQAFATPQRLADMVAKVKTALGAALPQAVKKMKLYLNNPSTHAILFKPIKSNIAEAHGQIAALLEAEYAPEEREQVALTTPAELGDLLDAL